MNDRHIKLCASMLQHAVWAEHTQDRRPSEVKETLRFFFTDMELACAIADITGKPRPVPELRASQETRPVPDDRWIKHSEETGAQRFCVHGVDRESATVCGICLRNNEPV